MRNFLLLSFAAPFLLIADEPEIPRWRATGALSTPRARACAVRLPSDRVWVLGGQDLSGPLATTEFYTPDGIFTPGPPLANPRAGHSCHVLRDGRVLVWGGDANEFRTAAIYDPPTERWTEVSDLGTARTDSATTLLEDGRLLIAAGRVGDLYLDWLEIFDPATLRLELLPARLQALRAGLKVNVLYDGRVLFSGGYDAESVSSDVYVWNALLSGQLLSFKMTSPRRQHSATLLDDGRVLLAGGTDGEKDLDSAEIFDPTTNELTPLSSRLSQARRDHAAIVYEGSDRVILAGGLSGNDTVAATDAFNSSTAEFEAVGNLTLARTEITTIPLPSGDILAVGGTAANGPVVAGGVLSLPAIQLLNTETLGFGSRVRIRFGNFGNATLANLRLLDGKTDITSRLERPSVSLVNGAAEASVLTVSLEEFGRALLLTARGNDPNRGPVSLTLRIPGTSSILLSPFRPNRFNAQPFTLSYVLATRALKPVSGSMRVRATVNGNLNSPFTTVTVPINGSGSGTIEVCCPPVDSRLLLADVEYLGSTLVLPSRSAAVSSALSNPNLPLRAPAYPAMFLFQEASISFQFEIGDQIIDAQRPRGTVTLLRNGSPVAQTTLDGTSFSGRISYVPTLDDARAPRNTICFVLAYSGDNSYPGSNTPSSCVSFFRGTPATLSLTYPNLPPAAPFRMPFGFPQRIVVVSRFDPRAPADRVSCSVETRPNLSSPPLLPRSFTLLPNGVPGELLGEITLTFPFGSAPGDYRLNCLGTFLSLDNARGDIELAMAPIQVAMNIVVPADSVANPIALRAQACTLTGQPVPAGALSGSFVLQDGSRTIIQNVLSPSRTLPICGSPASGPVNFGALGPDADIALLQVDLPAGTRTLRLDYTGSSNTQASSVTRTVTVR